MIIVEICALVSALALCVYAAVADLRKGIIKNRVLAVFAVLALVLDTVLYGIFARDLLVTFLVNTVMLSILSVALFYTHVWAGGDCKLCCVLALLYPAGMYVSYNGSYFTLLLAVAVAFVIGYFYLIVDAVIALCRKQWRPSGRQIGSGFCRFLISYVRVTVYLALFHQTLAFLFPAFYELPYAIQISLNIFLAWGIGTVRLLNKKPAFWGALICVILLALLTRRIPIGTDPLQYLLVFAVVLIQITISNLNYRTIPTREVCKGMILSAATTSLFAFSRVKGLPALSAEDLRSRLTEEEAASVRRWEDSAHGQAQVVIVRKIPFAIFVAVGFILYFLIWSVL